MPQYGGAMGGQGPSYGQQQYLQLLQGLQQGVPSGLGASPLAMDPTALMGVQPGAPPMGGALSLLQGLYGGQQAGPMMPTAPGGGMQGGGQIPASTLAALMQRRQP